MVMALCPPRAARPNSPNASTSRCRWESPHASFEPIHAPEANILCFRYRAGDAFNSELRERYNASGRGWITATNLEGRRVLRVTIMNPRTTPAHLAELLKGLGEVAGEIDG